MRIWSGEGIEALAVSPRRALIDAASEKNDLLIDAPQDRKMGVRVERILPAARRRLITISSKARVVEAARLLASETANLLVVRNDAGCMAGILTKTDIMHQIGQCRGCTCQLLVDAVMVRSPLCCEPADLLQPVWETMKIKGFREVPVLDNTDRPIGVVSARDALAALLEDVSHEEELLRDYVMSNGYR